MLQAAQKGLMPTKLSAFKKGKSKSENKKTHTNQ